jgi:hypothetical protein
MPQPQTLQQLNQFFSNSLLAEMEQPLNGSEAKQDRFAEALWTAWGTLLLVCLAPAAVAGH